jgi:nitrogen fixation NifU-like protein
MAYSDKVLDHYENPRNVGKLDDDDANVGTGMVGAPACGDVMRLQIKVDAKGVIEAKEIKNKDIADELGLPPVKIHCSVLAEDAIQAAIADVKAKREGESSS